MSNLRKNYTGKSFSEALILASTNPQNDKRLFIELRVQYIKIASSIFGLVDARISVSDKDLPVIQEMLKVDFFRKY